MWLLGLRMCCGENMKNFEALCYSIECSEFNELLWELRRQLQGAALFMEAWLVKLQKEAETLTRLLMWYLELKLFGNDIYIVLDQLINRNGT